MFIFYDGITALLFSCALSAVILIVLVVLLYRRLNLSAQSLTFSLLTAIFGFILAYLLFTVVGFKIQVALVQPYIQQTLDETCGWHTTFANNGQLSTGSGVEWQANDHSADCFYGDKGWHCSCHLAP